MRWWSGWRVSCQVSRRDPGQLGHLEGIVPAEALVREAQEESPDGLEGSQEREVWWRPEKRRIQV